MAVLFTESCDHNSMYRWDGSTMGYSATASKFGTPAFTCGFGSRVLTAPASSNRLMFACWIYYAGMGGDIGNWIMWGNAGNSEYGSLTMRQLGKIDVSTWGSSGGTYVGGFTLPSYSGAGWHWWEFDIKYASGTSGWVKVWVDGVQFANVTGISTLTSGTCSLQKLTINGFHGGFFGSGQNYMDDIIWLDEAAGLNSLPLGPMRIETIRPTSDITAQFTRSSGSTNYSLINETIPSTAEYVEASASGLKDIYDYANTTTNPQTIKSLLVNSYAIDPSSIGQTLKILVKSGATEDVTKSVTLTGVARNFQTEYVTDPDTGVAWTKSGVDAIQAGVKIP